MELAHAIVGLASLKSIGQADRLETQAGVDVVTLKQNFFLSGKLQFLHLEEAHPHYSRAIYFT